MLQNILEDYSTPDKAINKCWGASKTLYSKLAGTMKMGDVQLIRCYGYESDLCGMHKWYDKHWVDEDHRLRREDITHYMVRVGESFIDFTSRQFFRDAPYPTVYTSEDMNTMWAEWGEE